MKLVSMILPCYNHEAYLADCLNSLCAQTYPNMELLITDDCSRDGSYDLLQRWQTRLEQRFERVVIRKNPENQGVVKTLNGMLTECRGEYIKVLATDDMLLPEAIEEYVAFAQAEDCDVVFSNAYRFDAGLHWPLETPEKLEKVYARQPQWGENLTGALLSHNFICAPAGFMPRRTIEKYGLYDPAYIMEDYEYWLRVSVSGTIRYLDKCLVFYRSSPNSMSSFSLNEAQLRRHRIFSQQTIAIFSQYEQYADDAQKAEFFNRQLGTAVGLGDKVLSAELVAQMQQRKLPVSLWNRFRLLLIRINVYLWLKKVKHLLRR